MSRAQLVFLDDRAKPLYTFLLVSPDLGSLGLKLLDLRWIIFEVWSASHAVILVEQVREGMLGVTR